MWLFAVMVGLKLRDGGAILPCKCGWWGDFSIPVQKQLEIVEEFGLAVIAMARQAASSAAHNV